MNHRLELFAKRHFVWMVVSVTAAGLASMTDRVTLTNVLGVVAAFAIVTQFLTALALQLLTVRDKATSRREHE